MTVPATSTTDYAIGSAVAALFVLVLVYDVSRYRDEPAFKWLVPGGFATLFAGALLRNDVVVVGGIVTCCVAGFFSTVWRQGKPGARKTRLFARRR